MYDLVIRNARIADGLGNPLIEADLAVRDGKVAGDRSNPSGSSLQMRAGSPPAALGRGFGVWVVRERARGAGG